MLEISHARLADALENGLLIDFDVTHTGDDICLLMTHAHGSNHPEIHNLAWDVFLAAAEVAKSQGLYGAGQDLLKDAPSGNVGRAWRLNA
jgi:fructose 1,6-bisphosphate aldolase/phosphatase